MPTIKKVTPRAEAIVEVTEEQGEPEGIGEGIPGERKGKVGEGGVMVGGGLSREMEDTIHELDRFRTTAESEIRSLKERMDRMVTTISSMDDVRRSLYNLETRMQEIASLYDVLSLDVNPFVDLTLSGKKLREEPYISEIWTMKWLEFLLENISGFEVPNLLDYYKDIGWIDTTIESKAMTYIKSLRFDITPMDKAVTPDGDILSLDREDSEGWKLGPKDTITSFLFIQRIKGIRVDPELLEEMEDEQSRFLDTTALMSEQSFRVIDDTEEDNEAEEEMVVVDEPSFDEFPPQMGEPVMAPFSDDGTVIEEEFETPDFSGDMDMSDTFTDADAPPQDEDVQIPVFDEDDLDKLKEKLDRLSADEEG